MKSLRLEFNQKPFALSLFPSGKGEAPLPGLQVIGDGIELTALKRAEKGGCHIARVFNSRDCQAEARIVDFYGKSIVLQMSPFEAITLKLAAEGITCCDMMEFEI